MEKSNALSFIILHLLFTFINSVNDYVVFPLKQLPKESYLYNKNTNPEGIISKLYFSDLYTVLEIGTPIQKIPVLISFNFNDYFITSSKWNDTFNDFTKSNIYNFGNLINPSNQLSYFSYESSQSFEYERWWEVIGLFKKYNSKCKSNDTFYFYTKKDISKKKNLQKFYFLLVGDTLEKIPGKIGLPQPTILREFEDSIFKYFKNAELIGKYYFYFIFDSKNKKEGKLFIGNLPHEVYPKKYNENDLVFTYAFLELAHYQNWKLNFTSVSLGNKKLNSSYAELSYETDMIIGPEELKETLDNEYFGKAIDNGDCFKGTFNYETTLKEFYTFYYCKKDQQKKLYQLIPRIEFYSKELNYTFELFKEELFNFQEDDYIYMLVAFGGQQDNSYYWKLGKIFTSKYTFIYDIDEKRIGIYSTDLTNYNNESESFGKKLIDFIFSLTFLFILVCIAFFIVGAIFGKKTLNKTKKKRANELLDDDYIYENNENKNKTLDINQ